MRRATGLVALTDEEISSFRALGVQTPVHLVPNGIDVEKFRRIARPGSLADLGITESQHVILFLARLHQTKGADLLVDAFVKIAQQHREAVLVLAGPDEQGVLNALRATIASAGLSDRVITPGLVTGERKLDLLARADLFVLPSIGEGLSIATLEALASGTPPILSRECNLPIVGEVGAGAVLDRTAADFARAIDRFLVDPALRQEASERAYALARDRFGGRPFSIDWKTSTRARWGRHRDGVDSQINPGIGLQRQVNGHKKNRNLQAPPGSLGALRFSMKIVLPNCVRTSVRSQGERRDFRISQRAHRRLGSAIR